MDYVSQLRGSVIAWEEQPKYIKGYEKLYVISNHGKIFSIKSQKWLKPSITKRGYAVVSLSKNGVREKHLVHRLVYSAYKGECKGLKISHKKTYDPFSRRETTSNSLNRLGQLVVNTPKSTGENKKKYFRDYMRKYRKKKKEDRLLTLT